MVPDLTRPGALILVAAQVRRGSGGGGTRHWRAGAGGRDGVGMPPRRRLQGRRSATPATATAARRSPSSQASTATAAIPATRTTPATAAETRSPRPGASRTRAPTTCPSERKGGPGDSGPPTPMSVVGVARCPVPTTWGMRGRYQQASRNPGRPSQGAGLRRPHFPLPLRRSALAEVGRHGQAWRPSSCRTGRAGPSQVPGCGARGGAHRRR